MRNDFSARAVIPSVRSIHIKGPPNAIPLWDVQKMAAIDEVIKILAATGNIIELSLQNMAWVSSDPRTPYLALSGLSTISTLELLQVNFYARMDLVALFSNFPRLRHLVLEDVDCGVFSPDQGSQLQIAIPAGSYGLALRCCQDFSLQKRLRWDSLENQSSEGSESGASVEELANMAIAMSKKYFDVGDLLPTFGCSLHRLQLAAQTIPYTDNEVQFNAVSDWVDGYIAYDSLKRDIYQLEKEQHGEHRPYRDLEANEQETLLGQTRSDVLFEPLLNEEMKKITSFYKVQEKEITEEVGELEALVKVQEDIGLGTDERYLDDPDEDEEDDDESISHSPERRRRISSSRRNLFAFAQFIPEAREASGSARPHRLSISSEDSVEHEVPGGTVSRLATKIGDTLRESFISTGSVPADATIWNSKSDYAYDIRLTFKRRITRAYVAVANLKSYVEVNYSGFRKILKKYDKVTYSELKDRYMRQTVETSYPFTRDAKDKVDADRRLLVDLYTKCVTNGDRRLASQQLKLHQRENIAWERDTVWRQMIAQERKGDVEGEPLTLGALYRPPGPGLFFIPTPLGTIRVTKKMIYKIIAGTIFVTLLNVQTLEAQEANRCFAILVLCTFLWATEAIPLFVTSMFVPLLLVLLQVIRGGDGKVLSRPAATQWVFSIMFSPTIMLLIGGFTISSALSKTNIDRVLITKVLSLAGTKPSTVLLAFMGVSCFASMWIRTLPPKSAFGPCLILAIALAANIGGQSSPISSPQNLIALHEMDPALDWASWFAVALPVSAISILLIWVMLLISYKPARSPDGDGEIEIKQIRPTKERFTHKQWWVTIVCLVTIGLWCVAHSIEPYVGDMGVIAIIPIVAFFSTGVLKKDDFEQFMWTIVFLAMGGIALGKGVMSSGLLGVVDGIVKRLVDGVSLYGVVLILSPIVLIISTFISHTIASVLLVPIAAEIGKNLAGEDHKNILIFITALICSAGMGMPVSGFPNQTAATQEDELGELYLSNIDFLKNGVPASIVATIIVSTVGYVLMLAVGM
ncbi:hypothetical protein H0H93_004595 [Arthromyces matolae]|nr:hypothetical protein H0H93_004595 [Arthromyces matolae]